MSYTLEVNVAGDGDGTAVQAAVIAAISGADDSAKGDVSVTVTSTDDQQIGPVEPAPAPPAEVTS